MQQNRDGIRPHPRLGWLAAIVPVSARRFRVRDREFASAISAGGGELVQSSPDVEISAADELVGDARVAIVPIGVQSPRVGRGRPLRAVRRLADAALVSGRIAAARRTALRRGYDRAIALPWEPQTKLPPSLVGAAHGALLFQRFPRQAVVVCRRGPPEATALEAGLAAASRELGRELDVRAVVLGSSGVLVGPAEDVVLRVSLGPAARQIEDQRAALASLRVANPGALVAERVPWILASGSPGLARWSVERRLPGTLAPDAGREITEDCLDFLGELFVANVEGASPASPTRDAEICAEHFPEHAETMRDLGRRLEDTLAGMPRGFGHGDFWTGNLLVENGRLAGVVDWPSAGPGRFPLFDVFQLRAQQMRERTGARLASVVIGHLLPQASAGGHELDRAFCRRLALDLSSSDLESLVGAYWLEELRHALVDSDRDPVELTRPEWRRVNLEALRVLARTCGLRGGSV